MCLKSKTMKRAVTACSVSGTRSWNRISITSYSDSTAFSQLIRLISSAESFCHFQVVGLTLKHLYWNKESLFCGIADALSWHKCLTWYKTANQKSQKTSVYENWKNYSDEWCAANKNLTNHVLNKLNFTRKEFETGYWSSKRWCFILLKIDWKILVVFVFSWVF